jgi:protein TonB
MTLIPMLTAIMAAPEAATAPAGAPALFPRNSYGSDTGRHPVAALLAIGLPVALVVAVALSPMIVDKMPTSARQTWEPITLKKPLDPPPPETAPDSEPIKKAASTTETVKPLVETAPLGEIFVDRGPVTLDPPPLPPGPSVASDPPPMPKFVLAQLDPKYAGVFQPDYPAREQRAEIEGVVKVRVLIGTDGHVKAVELVSGDNSSFFEATKRRALAKWRFKPATRGGVAEESWKEMTVRFEIKNA